MDNVIATVDNALKRQGLDDTKNLARWKEEMPTEQEMRPKDKYTMFDRKEKRYRKGIHSESLQVLLIGGYAINRKELALIFGDSRATEMDEGQSADKSPGVLRGGDMEYWA